MVFGFAACLAAAARLRRRYAHLLRRHVQLHRLIVRPFRAQVLLGQPVAPVTLDHEDVPLSFFEIFPPEVRNVIFEYAFGEPLCLRPAMPKPKEKPHPDFCLRVFQKVAAAVSPADVAPPLTLSTKLASLTVCRQWKAEVEPFLKPDATWDVSEHHRLICLQPKWSFESFRFVKHIVISHLSAPNFPFQHMPNLESCVIRRGYSRHWLDPLRFWYGPGSSLGTIMQWILANPVEYLMHIEFSRYLEMWLKIQHRTRRAGTDPKFTFKGSLRRHKGSFQAVHTDYIVDLQTWKITLDGRYPGGSCCEIQAVDMVRMYQTFPTRLFGAPSVDPEVRQDWLDDENLMVA